MNTSAKILSATLSTKVLLVARLSSSNQFLPHPLQPVEKVVNKGIAYKSGKELYIRVGHAKGKAESVFSIRHFLPYNKTTEASLKKRYSIKD